MENWIRLEMQFPTRSNGASPCISEFFFNSTKNSFHSLSASRRYVYMYFFCSVMSFLSPFFRFVYSTIWWISYFLCWLRRLFGDHWDMKSSVKKNVRLTNICFNYDATSDSTFQLLLLLPVACYLLLTLYTRYRSLNTHEEGESTRLAFIFSERNT